LSESGGKSANRPDSTIRVSELSRVVNEPSTATDQPSASVPWPQGPRVFHSRGVLESDAVQAAEHSRQLAALTEDAGPVRPARDALFRRLLGLADLAGTYLALAIAVVVIGGRGHALRPTAALVGLFVVLASKAIGLYDRDEHTLRKSTVDELPKILYLSISFALVVWLAEQLLVRGWLGRAQVFGLALGSFVFVTLARTIARHIALMASPPERCLLIGNLRDATRAAGKLTTSPSVKAQIVGRVPLSGSAMDMRPAITLPTLGDAASLGSIVAQYDVERAIIAPEGDDQETLHVIRLLKALGVKVSVLPRLLEVVGSSTTFDEVDGITLLGVRRYGLSKSSAILKRLMDVIAAVIGLALIAPVLLVIAIAIKLDSRGPVFFKQRRIGRWGTQFEMIKFRSMVKDAEQTKDDLRASNEAEGGLFKIRADPRITRVGRILRQTSLDELPQLFNVLRSDMSLVGPRPLVPDEDALIEGWQRWRLAVKPGMTGLWQIYGSSRIPMNEMLKIDYLYGANWSLWLDLKILLRTLPYVMRRRGL
jgi:exopolysaccharide biosynthesis polyprenyl glycosylphosphotransferase